MNTVSILNVIATRVFSGVDDFFNNGSIEDELCGYTQDLTRIESNIRRLCIFRATTADDLHTKFCALMVLSDSGSAVIDRFLGAVKFDDKAAAIQLSDAVFEQVGLNIDEDDADYIEALLDSTLSDFDAWVTKVD